MDMTKFKNLVGENVALMFVHWKPKDIFSFKGSKCLGDNCANELVNSFKQNTRIRPGN